MIVENAPAKVNLYLHIGPTRRDGLHDLASLFVFAEKGDVIRVEAAKDFNLTVSGPYADSLQDLPAEKNIVMVAARRLANEVCDGKAASITLEKNLPVAAGVGGGSADAAAALRALVRLWHADISEAALAKLTFSLGADVPACLARAPVNVSGAGERLDVGPALPPLWIALVNPRVAMPTGPVFRAFDSQTPTPAPAVLAHAPAPTYEGLRALMGATRNDLEPHAIVLAPVIRDVLDWLAAAPGALAARMSGSGATCFALFASESAAQRAAHGAGARGWWAMASRLHVR